MVAKARGDLFDVNIGGAGFHFTSHLIALVALFIACFAIAGYISYRTDSIPASAVKDGDGFADENVSFNNVTVNGTLTTTYQTGTPSTGWTAVESAIGKLHNVTLTAPTAIVDAFTVASGNDLAVGYQVYTLPAGALTVTMAHMNVGLKAASAEQTGDQPKVGIGTVMGLGETDVLTVSSGEADILISQVATDVDGTATVATVNDQVLRRSATDAHTVFLNIADGWATDTGGDLTVDITANSSITIQYLMD